jgi:hypothetical protein
MYFDLYTSGQQPGRPNIHNSRHAFTNIKPVVNSWNRLFIGERRS